MFKHKTHPKRSRRDAVDVTSDLSEHPNVSIVRALLLSDTCYYMFEEVYSLNDYILAILPRFRSFGRTNKL